MAISKEVAFSKIEQAAGLVFDADPRVRSLGIAKTADGFGFVAIRNTAAIVALGGRIGGPPVPVDVDGIAVEYVNSSGDPTSLARVPHTGPARPGAGSLILEQQQHRPLVCGLQVQNFDDDVRTGEIAKGYLIIGTLGCFVRLANNDVAILSNNHVLAGENRGASGIDRILQAGGATFSEVDKAATLTDYAALNPSPAGATIASGTVFLNAVDGAVANLETGVGYTQNYLPNRGVKAAIGAATAAIGDKVHKVGRTTGLTFGTVKQIGVVVGPISYAPGQCWFKQCIVVEGDNGSTFSDHGDSGSAIVRDDGMVIGLLFAGNGQQTYACDIRNVLQELNCSIA